MTLSLSALSHCSICLQFSQFPHKLTRLKNLNPKLSTLFNNLRVRSKVTSSKSSGDKPQVTSPELIRNVGIMAHIDAGKTTTTERFLYYSGVIVTPGEVHHGDTVTDFLPQERERGITIQSAVVSFPWRGHHINLIDTPGHVDFTFEVQRSLRVVDSAVAIIDASAGVEAQTLTVWRQATDYQLPRIIFLNKMDKASASVDKSLESIVSRLKCIPLLIQKPFYNDGSGIVGSGSGLAGVIDLIHMQRLIFDPLTKGNTIIAHDVSGDTEVVRARCDLIERVADIDSQLATQIIESENIEAVTPKELSQALKRVTLKQSAVPVLVGSAYKNIGVQPLLDAVLRYLPHPLELKERDAVIKAYGTELCGFAFKTIHDPQLGPLTFVRLFRGELHTGQKLFNATRNKAEKITKIYLPLADDLHEIKEISGGQVVIVSGLKETITGDTLTSSSSISHSVERRLKNIQSQPSGDDKTITRAVLSGVQVPDPVFFCAIEPPSVSQQKALDAALECLQREDPSLHVHVDPDTSQTVLSGMGELHLDIIHSRLKSEFKVDADLGKIQVAYKETIASPCSKRILFDRTLADQRHSVTIELSLTPTISTSQSSEILSPKIKIYKGRDKDKCENLATLNERTLKHIQNGVDATLRFGPKLSFPVIHVDVTLHWFESSRGTSETIIEAASASCLRQCLQSESSGMYLLEPVVNLEITVDEKYQRVVLDDLNRRRFLLSSIDLRHGNHVISGTSPLSELMGYSTILRTVSSGLGTFSMYFSHYQLVNNPIQEQKIFTSVRGF